MGRTNKRFNKEERTTTKRDKKSQNRSERKQRKLSIEDELLLEAAEDALEILEDYPDEISDPGLFVRQFLAGRKI